MVAALIVRDLLTGPRRFSDLRRSLTAITPKWLSARLRALEGDGIVQREAASEREVWYQLTPKGQALAPVIDALLVWGIDYALGSPRPGEAIHPGRVMDAAIRYLERGVTRPARPVVWGLRFGERWSRQRGEAVADVVVETSPEGWVRFLAADRDKRHRWLAKVRAQGTPKRIEELASAFGPGPASTR